MPGRSLRPAFVLCGMLLAAPSVVAQPPAGEMLPPPRAVPQPPVMAPPVPVEMMLFPRHNRYEVWQYSSIDRAGRWRPLVNYTAEGAWYRYDGAPYPWMTTHPETFRPLAVEPANFRR